MLRSSKLQYFILLVLALLKLAPLLFMHEPLLADEYVLDEATISELQMLGLTPSIPIRGLLLHHWSAALGFTHPDLSLPHRLYEMLSSHYGLGFFFFNRYFLSHALPIYSVKNIIVASEIIFAIIPLLTWYLFKNRLESLRLLLPGFPILCYLLLLFPTYIDYNQLMLAPGFSVVRYVPSILIIFILCVGAIGSRSSAKTLHKPFFRYACIMMLAIINSKGLNIILLASLLGSTILSSTLLLSHHHLEGPNRFFSRTPRLLLGKLGSITSSLKDIISFQFIIVAAMIGVSYFGRISNYPMGSGLVEIHLMDSLFASPEPNHLMLYTLFLIFCVIPLFLHKSVSRRFRDLVPSVPLRIFLVTYFLASSLYVIGNTSSGHFVGWIQLNCFFIYVLLLSVICILPHKHLEKAYHLSLDYFTRTRSKGTRS